MTRVKANSRAASVPKEDAIVTEMVDGLIVSKPAKRIEYLSAKAEEPTAQTVVTKYDMGGSSSGNQVYQCGTHDYKTKSLKEFNDHITLSHNDTGRNKIKDINDFMNSNRRI